MGGRDTDTLPKAGLKHGDMLHVNAENATMTNVVQAKVLKTQDELHKDAEENAKKKEDAGFKQYQVDSGGRTIKTIEKKEDKILKDSKGQVLKVPEKEAQKEQVSMINKKVLGDNVDHDNEFRKH